MTPGPLCATCGEVLSTDMVFCVNCGSPVQRRAAATDPGPRHPAYSGSLGTQMIGNIGAAAVPNSYDISGPAHPSGTDPRPGPLPGTGVAASGRTSADGQIASFGRRVAAYAIDWALGASITLGGYSIVVAGALSRSVTTVGTGFLFLLAAPMLWFVVLVAMGARGSSPGKALLGLRVIRATDGRPPGFGVAIGRLLLLGLLLTVTIYIAGFSPLWDRSGRRQGWWDAALGTVVVIRSGSTPAAEAAPVATASSMPSDHSPDLAWSPSRPTPEQPAPSSTDLVAASRPAADSIAAGEPDSDYKQRGPIRVPPAVFADLDAPKAQPPLITAVPGGLNRVEDASETIELTRMALKAKPAIPSTLWRVELDDGRSLAVAGRMLVGRDPEPAPDEAGATLVAVPDPARSISKTHLLLDVSDRGLTVTDRFSTNGVVVVSGGRAGTVVPGEPTPIARGNTVRFGQRSFTVS